MTRAQEATLIVFFGLLSATIAISIGYDVWLSATGPDNATTISWSLNVLGHAYPIVAFGLGFLSATFTVGLGVHFFFSMDSPADWDELVQDRWIIAHLRSAGVTIPEVPPDLDYN